METWKNIFVTANIKKYFYKYINNNRTLSSNTVRVVPVVGVGVAVSVVQVGGVAGAGGQQPGQQLGEVEQRGVHTCRQCLVI